MSHPAPYRILGSLGSPYSMKMRAIFRYRRIAHVWINLGPQHEGERRQVKAPVIPVIQYPDGSYHNDSTPMIYALEAAHTERSIIPEDEADRFLAVLLEDFADEWATKWMFHYRWFRERDQRFMSRWLAFDSFKGGGLERIQSFADMFRDRQVGRMALVGCTEENQPLIEATANEALALLDRHVVERHYFFGTRPSLAEFSLFGQLSQLGVDPTPYDLLRDSYPYALRWLWHMDDAGGVEGEWDAPGAPASVVSGLLAMAGSVYFPFLIANAEAIAAGRETFSFAALGHPYTQGVFKYQIKCFAALRAAYAALSPAARERLAPVLDAAGCLAPLRDARFASLVGG